MTWGLGSGAAAPALHEDFSSDPLAQSRFSQSVEGTETVFGYNAGTANLTALVDVDSTPAFYLSNPFEPLTETNDLSFSVEFRVTAFDARANPTAFLGLMTTRHVEDFGDGLTLVISVAEGVLAANANLDAFAERAAGDTVELEPNTPYRAVGRYQPASREFSVAFFDGNGFTNLVRISTARLPATSGFHVDRLGIQNGGGELVDQSVGSITLVVDEFHLPARGRPRVSFGSGRTLEGDTGTHAVDIPVELSFPTDLPSSVGYETTAGTALAGTDFVASTGQVTFLPGQTTGSLRVEVLGDRVIEPDETFQVRATSFVNTIAEPAFGTVTIANDDGVAGRLDHFEWAPVLSPQATNQPFAIALTARDAFGQLVADFLGTAAIRSTPIPSEAVVGAASTPLAWSYPLATASHDARTQVIYPAAELGGAGRLTALSLFIQTAPARRLTNWTIRIKHTSMVAYPATPSWDSSGWTTVHRSSPNLTASGWVTFPFSVPFDYDGVSGLLVDFSFNTALGGREAFCRSSDTTRTRSLTFASNSANGDPLVWSARSPVPVTSTRVPEARFAVERLAPLSPAIAGPFVQGAWQGWLTIPVAATNLQLEADDGLTHTGRSNPFTIGVLGDLAVGLGSLTPGVRLGQPLVYRVSVTNLGLGTVNEPVVSDRLPAEVRFLSATGPRGSCEVSGQDVDCRPGSLESGATASFDITVLTLAQGAITNRARVVAPDPDPFAANNLAILVTTIDPPLLSIQDASVVEGSDGATDLFLEVRLSTADREVRVDFRTVDNTARAGEDYQPTSGTLVFPLGTNTARIRVPILGDLLAEDPETFSVILERPVNAAFFRSSAFAIITDDDAAAVPCLAAVPTAILEGDLGTTNALLQVTLSRPSGQTVTVDYESVTRTAAEGVDFPRTQGVLTFAPGVTSVTLPVPVFPDRLVEPDETFDIRFGRPRNATLCAAEDFLLVAVRILNDDGLAGRLDHFSWSPIPSPQATNQPFTVILTARDALERIALDYSGTVNLRTPLRDVEQLAGVAPGGAAGAPWGFPLAGAAYDARTQVIYPASELGGPGRITSLSLFVGTTPGRRLTNWTIRLKPTSLAAYSGSPSWDGTGWTTVHRSHANITATGWATFAFTTPFDYSGTGNLLVDFSFNTSSQLRDGASRAYDSRVSRTLTATSNNANGDPLAWTGRTPVPSVATRVPEIRLNLQRPIALSPTSVTFTGGTWQGQLTVPQPATALVVTADDDQLHTGASNPFDVGTLGDLTVGVTASPASVRVGQTFEYVVTISNLGLTPATGVVVTDRLPPEVRLASVEAGGTAWSYDGRDVRCDVGSLASGATWACGIFVETLSQGLVTNHVRVLASEPDPAPANNLATLVSLVTPPVLSVLPASITEGDSGSRELLFPVRLSPADREVRVNWRTTDGTARAGEDYLAGSGSLVFPLGTTTNAIRVAVIGDVLTEDNETFTVELLAPSGADLFTPTATGLILDDDLTRLPCLEITDVTVLEGDTGTTNLVFGVRLSAPSGQTVTVDFATVSLGATAGADFVATQGTLSLPPGSTRASVTVVGLSDRLAESNESFGVRFTRPVNAAFCGGDAEWLATGVLLNDDGVEGKLDHFAWALIPSPQGTNRPFQVTITAQDAQLRTVAGFTNPVELRPSSVLADTAAPGAATNLNWNYPLAGSLHDARTQVLYPRNELGGPGRLTSLALDLGTTPGRRLTNLTIRLKTTPLSVYPPTPNWETSGWTTVYRANANLVSTGRVTFVFTTPFAYDGSANLLVDFSFNTGTTGRDAFVRATDTRQNRALTFASNSGNGDPLTWSARNPVPVLGTRVPEIRFAFERPFALLPTRTGSFVDGVWTGELTVLQPVVDATVEADDGQLHTGRSNPFTVGILGDLAVGVASDPTLIRLGQSFTYRLGATNLGLATATGVVLTDRLPPEVRFVAAAGPRGACRFDGRDVLCDLGTLDPAGTASFDVTVVALAQGTLTNRVRVLATEPDPDPANNLVVAPTVVSPPLLSILDTTVTEGPGGTIEAVFTVRASASDQPIQVDYATVSGSAVAGGDFTAAAGTLLLPAGTTTNWIRVPILDDALPEDGETFTLALSNPLHAELFDPIATGTILDDDSALRPCLTIADSTVAEPDGRSTNATFVVSLSQPSGQTVSANFRTADLTALAGSDYRAASGTVTFPPGTTTRTVEIEILADNGAEPDERFEFLLSNPQNAQLCPPPAGGVAGHAVGTILNDDGVAGVLDHFEWAPIPSPQGTNVPFEVTLTARDALGQVVPAFAGTVEVLTLPAAVPLASSTVGPFVGGLWQGAITVLRPATNLVLEADDGRTHTGRSNPFTVGLLADLAIGFTETPASARVGQSLTYRFAVTNLGLIPATGVVVSDRLPPELRFERIDTPRGACEVIGRDLTCSLGTLEPGARLEFTLAATALAQGSVTNRIRVLGDGVDANPGNNLALATALVTPPALAIQNTTIDEGDGDPATAIFTVRLSASGREVRVDYATADGSARAGEDYLATSGTLVFPIGITTNFIRVPILGDTRPEELEGFVVHLTNPQNATLFASTGSASILDDDLPGISVQPARSDEGDEGPGQLTFQVTVHPARSEPVSVRYATADVTALAGRDYHPATGTLDFAPGVTLRTVAVEILGNRVHETDKTLRLQLSEPRGAVLAKAAAPGTIVNDDFPDARIDDTLVNLAIPGTSNAVLHVTLSYPSLQSVAFDYHTVDGSATAGTDYQAQAGSVVIPPGSAGAEIHIPIDDNTLDETNEFFHVVLTLPEHVRLADDQGRVTIINEGRSNTPPTLQPLAPDPLLEDAPESWIPFLAADAETPVAELRTAASSSNPLVVDASGLRLSGSDLFVRPMPDAFGETTITLSITDAAGAAATTQFPILVRPVNDPPSFTPGPDQTVPDTAPLTSIAAWASGLRAGPPNEAAQQLAFELAVDRPGLFRIPPAISPQGTLAFAPAANTNGTAIIQVRLRDNGGTANGGRDLSDLHTLRLTVTHLNTPPTLAALPDSTILEDSAPRRLPLAFADAESPATSLTVSAASSRTDLVGPAQLAVVDGALALSPLPDAFGETTITVTVTDPEGASVTRSFRLVVLPVNDPPSFTPGPDQTIPGTTPLTSIAHWASNLRAGPPNEAAQQLAFELAVDRPGLFRIPPAINPQGTLTFAPAANTNGTATLQVRLRDNGGTADGGRDLSEPHTLRLTVTTEPGNLPPVVRLVAPEDGLLVGAGFVLGLTAEASDPDGRIQGVEFFRIQPATRTNRLGAVPVPPYTLAYADTADSGAYTFVARAEDDRGATAWSAPVSVTTTNLFGDILVIRHDEDPELRALLAHLEAPEYLVMDEVTKVLRWPVTHQLDRARLHPSLLRRFRLVIWDDLGRSPSAVRDRDVEALWDAWQNGVSLLLIGENLAEPSPDLTDEGRRRWQTLIAAAPSPAVTRPGLILRAEPSDRENELFRGSYWGVVNEDLSYPRPVRPGRWTGDGEVRATLGDQPVLVRLPGFEQFENPFEGRRIVQSFLVDPGTGDPAELDRRRVLLRNSVQWLLGGECDNFAANLSVEDRIAEFAPCRPFRVTATLDNSGACSAGGIILSNLVADGLEVVGVEVRSTTGDVPQTVLRLTDRSLAVGIGQVGGQLLVDTWLVARRPGTYTNTLVRLLRYRTTQSFPALVRITGPDCDCPQLEVSGGAVRIRPGCAVETILQSSADLGQWTDLRAIPAGQTGVPIPVPASPSPGGRFYRLVFPAQ